MDWYTNIAWAAIAVQLLFVYSAARNYRYALSKYNREEPPLYHPRTALIVPCKGLDTRFRANIRSFVRQGYDNFRLYFVVEDTADPAYNELCAIRSDLESDSKALDIQILVAGLSNSCSQKIHNLLYAFHQLPEDIEVLAFADSDACVHRDWLRHLVWPLRLSKCGIATGYRWFVPIRDNLATLVMSAINASVAQFLGNNRFNHPWGGSMAVRIDDFRRLQIPELWDTTLSDDLSLGRAVREAGMTITFVPGCLVASYESTTWAGLYEFCRRQFLITRVYTPGTWWLGLLSSMGGIVGLWGGLAAAIYAAGTGAKHLPLYITVPVVFFAGQLVRAALRQAMISTVLKDSAAHLRAARRADVAGTFLWSPLLLFFILSSAIGRTIHWRNIRYKLVSPTRTEVLD